MFSGNANYTHIQAHGTPSALEPGFIAQSATVGPYGFPVAPISSSLNVDVNLAGASVNDLFVLGAAIPAGSIFTSVVLNAKDSLEAGAILEFGLAESKVGVDPALSTVFCGVQVGTAAAVSGVPGADLNGGQVFINGFAVSSVPNPVTTGNLLYPVLKVVTPITDPIPKGSCNVKVSYISV
jgi:hypothetical protein